MCDSVNRSNIKVNLGRYTAKRPVKEERNLVWMDVANEMVGEEYAIVYLDFRKEVDLLISCLKEAGIQDAQAYHGKPSQKEKRRIDTEFRGKQFQLLVGMESYEVGSHSPPVRGFILLFRIACMHSTATVWQSWARQ